MKHLLALLALTLALSLFAATEIVNGIEWTYSISSGKATIGTGSWSTPAIPNTTSGAIAIPEQLGGAEVTAIGRNAFNECTQLTKIIIPEGVTSIGYYSFRNCSSVTTITLPSTLETIDTAAFEYCTNLPTLVIPQSVTVIKDWAFASCSKLTSINIPNGITTIENRTFADCPALTSIAIPEGVTSIGSSAFSGCSSLTSVTIPEGVTTIEDGAFGGCSSLTLVTIPEGVTSIGSSAFSDCSSLASVTIPDSVTTIGSSAFYGCRSLASVTIPEGVTSIGSEAFYGVQTVYLHCAPPSKNAQNIGGNNKHFPKKYAGAWEKVFSEGARQSLSDVMLQANVTVSAEMTTPKTMAVTYTVERSLPTVKVRAVAFKDGVRSFANLVPVTQGEGVPKGESVETNKEYTFVWNVSEDWDVDLSKVAVEILVQEGTLLPQELVTIPEVKREGVVEHAAMTITRNALNERLLFNALLWCMAESDTALTNTDGVVTYNGATIANGTDVSTYRVNTTALLNYLYGKMGYKVLAGEDLTYAKTATRINFADSGIRQVAVKIEEPSASEE